MPPRKGLPRHPEGDVAGRKGRARKGPEEAACGLRVRREGREWGGERGATRGNVCRSLDSFPGMSAGPGQGWQQAGGRPASGGLRARAPLF